MLHGSFSYASARELVRHTSSATSNEGVTIFGFSDVGYMDASATTTIDSLFEMVADHGREIMIVGLQGSVQGILDGFGVLDSIPYENRFEYRLDAIEAALIVAN